MSIEKNIERIANALEQLVELKTVELETFDEICVPNKQTAEKLTVVTEEAVMDVPDEQLIQTKEEPVNDPFDGDENQWIQYVTKKYGEWGNNDEAAKKVMGALSKFDAAQIQEVPKDKLGELYTVMESL